MERKTPQHNETPSESSEDNSSIEPGGGEAGRNSTLSSEETISESSFYSAIHKNEAVPLDSIPPVVIRYINFNSYTNWCKTLVNIVFCK